LADGVTGIVSEEAAHVAGGTPASVASGALCATDAGGGRPPLDSCESLPHATASSVSATKQTLDCAFIESSPEFRVVVSMNSTVVHAVGYFDGEPRQTSSDNTVSNA